MTQLATSFQFCPDVAVGLQAKVDKLAIERHCPDKYERMRLGREFTTRTITDDDGNKWKVPHLRGEFTTKHTNPPSWIGPKWGQYTWVRVVTFNKDNGASYGQWQRRRRNYIDTTWGYVHNDELAAIRKNNVDVICTRCRECDTQD